jgi:hypothetical protein
MVNTVFRMYKSTAAQAVERFGFDNVGTFIQKTFEKRPDEEVEILHAVLPRLSRDVTKRDNLNMPFMSVYVCKNTGMVISEGGFEELPYVVPRFLKATGEVMGRSPAMTALPDVKMLNLMSKTIIQAAQKVESYVKNHHPGGSEAD